MLSILKILATTECRQLVGVAVCRACCLVVMFLSLAESGHHWCRLLVWRVQKSAALTLLGIGFSVTAWLLQYLWQNVQDLLVSYSYYVIIYFVATGVISFAVCYYRGPVTNPRLLDLIRWSIQLVALALIYYSSQIAEVSATIIALVVMITLIPRRFYMLGIPAFVVRYW